MTDYLAHAFPWGDPDKNWVMDDVFQWSALCGTLLLRHLPLPRRGLALDLGSGFGYPAIELAQRCGVGVRVLGIDSWAHGVNRARLKAALMGVPNVSFLCADVLRLPLAGAAARLVTANLLINNVPQRAALVRECRRVLGPGGVLALGTNVRGHMSELYTAFAEVLRDERDDAASERLAVHVAHRVDEEEMRTLLADAGFTGLRCERDATVLRFVDGSSLLRHFLIREAFLDDWRRVVTPETEQRVFSRLEARLNEMAYRSGELRLSIPLLYVEATC